jgi:hypothetical protein
MEHSEGFYLAEQLPEHTLRDVNGKEIGLIMGVGPGYADVATGPLHLTGNLYVPFEAISYCTETHCYLNLTLDQVKQQGWNILPQERPTASPGLQNEMRIPFRPEERK